MRKKVVSLWKQTDKNGNPYMTGTVDLGVSGTVSIVVFPNDKKKLGTQPDWNGVLSEPREKAEENPNKKDNPA